MSQWFIEYLAGLVAGDGYFDVNVRRRSFALRVYDKSREFLDIVALLCSRFVGVEGRVYARRGGRFFELIIYGELIVKRVIDTLNRCVEDPTPPFAMGLGDAEASVIRGNPNRIKFSIRDEKLFKAYTTVLRQLDIGFDTYVEKRKNGVDYVARIHGIHNIAKYAKRVGFIHPDKRRKLKTYWNIEPEPDLKEILDSSASLCQV